MSSLEKRYRRTLGFVVLLIFVGATQVISAFNNMVQPSEPFALVQLYPSGDDNRKLGVLGKTFEVPVKKIEREVKEANELVVEGVKALPWAEGKNLLKKAGLIAVRQAESWWGQAVKVIQERGDVKGGLE